MIDFAAVAKAVGVGGSSTATAVLASYLLFVPEKEYDRHVAESERTFILDVVEKARSEPAGPYKDSLCRTLDEAIGRLCAAARDDALCVDRAMLRERAGC